MLWSLFKKVGILPLDPAGAPGGVPSDGAGRAGNESESLGEGEEPVKVLKKGHAMRVIFFYPGEEGTYVDNANVTLYENGIVHIRSSQEETTTMLQNCEILWNFELESEERQPKVRLLKPKSQEGRVTGPVSDDKTPTPEA
jgi:hypothetical protein